ncbi:MAG: orotidine-5'-phosphate decarboxylase [Alphaproteobacteria bacterium]|nr:orotidine-5'-phosphate decarboxylase [Alphaproteobacteria bacterium]
MAPALFDTNPVRVQARDRLIVALDVGSVREAKGIVQELDDTVSFYKIGPHLLLDPELHDLLRHLKAESKAVFLDLKVFDIPATVEGAVRAAAALGVKFITVAGQQPIMEAAVKARGNTTLQILVVTLLTYMTQEDLKREYGSAASLDEFILERAKFAADRGCDGVISSAKEVRLIRENIERKDFLIVTPGIRPDNSSLDDQKRVVTPYDAIKNGSNYLVIGRPIISRKPRCDAAMAILREIQQALNDKIADNSEGRT